MKQALAYMRSVLVPVYSLVALFVGALVLRLYRLDAQSLWLDEGGTWAEVTGRTGKGWLVLFGELFSPNASYPLYHLILKAWVQLAGDSEWALRLPSALAGALAVLVLAWVVRGNRRTAEPQNREPRTAEPQNQRTKEQEASRPSRLRVRTKNQEPRTAEPKNQRTKNLRAFAASRENQEPITNHQLPIATYHVLLLIVSPFAIWHAQDAKAYSLLLLAMCCLIWAVLQLVNRASNPSQPAAWWHNPWLHLLMIAGISLLVHRLALFVVAGALLALALILPQLRRWQRIGLALIASLGSYLGVAGVIRAAAAERAFSGRGALGVIDSLWLTFVRFVADRAPGDLDGYLGIPLVIWLLPALILTIWGTLHLVRAALRNEPYAIVILCLTLVPLVLLVLLAVFSPIYEPRYAMVVFPGWLLVVGAAGRAREGEMGRQQEGETARARERETARPSEQEQTILQKSFVPSFLRSFVLQRALQAAMLLISILMLFQPAKGIFSGDPVKEQWREAVQELAWRLHPDDLLLIHPYYVADMYAYYAPRVTPDPLPQPAIFPIFAEGDTCGKADAAQIRECWRQRYEPFFNRTAQGRKRALLLIAPEHARTVDPPKSLAELQAETPAGQPLPTSADRYGWVGLRFQYPQKTWPCGGTGNALIGVEVMCQSFPETFSAVAGAPGVIPEPATPLDVTFGGELRLRGYSINPHNGTLRAQGILPITLYWNAIAQPRHPYRMFLHLCQVCNLPPVANDDGPPLAGYEPAGNTTTWQIGDPLHDERSIRLPKDLPPGRYTLLLGVYYGDQRLAISGNVPQLEANRLVLGEVMIVR
jgi:hypothetical protein